MAQEIKYYSYTYLTKLAKQIPFLFIYVWVILLLNVKISINTAGIKSSDMLFRFYPVVSFQAEVQFSRVQAAFCQQSENREKE